MKNTEIESLQKECDRLGIITIEADSMLSVELAKTAIAVVKSVNLDFKQLAKTAQQKRAAMKQ